MDATRLFLVMASLPDAFWAVSQSAASALVASIWQGVLLAAGLAVCLRFAPRASASLRFTIWTGGFATLAALPILSLVRSYAISNELAQVHAGAQSVAVHPLLLLDARWSLAIAGLWLTASLYRAADLTWHVIQLRGLWQRAIPVSGDGAKLEISQGPLGIRKVQLCTTAELERPSVIGFFAPRILIPGWLMGQLTPSELDQILLHETEHLRRGDDWTNLLQKAALVVFPLNPALLWMERHLCREREMACDEGVVRRTQAPRAYAACLASLAERGLEHRTQSIAMTALSLGAWQRRPELVRRVHSILLQSQQLSPWATRGLLAAMGCGLVAASLGLTHAPEAVGFATPTPAPISAVDAKALVARPQIASAQGAQPVVPAATPTKHAARKTAASKPVSNAPAGTEVAELTTQQEQRWIHTVTLSSEGEHEQNWIVLTTWRQDPLAHQAEVVSDFAVPENASPASGETAAQPASPDAPKTFVFPALAAVHTRSGWVIIQL